MNLTRFPSHLTNVFTYSHTLQLIICLKHNQTYPYRSHIKHLKHLNIKVKQNVYFLLLLHIHMALAAPQKHRLVTYFYMFIYFLTRKPLSERSVNASDRPSLRNIILYAAPQCISYETMQLYVHRLQLPMKSHPQSAHQTITHN